MQQMYAAHNPPLSLENLSLQFEAWRASDAASRLANPYFGKNSRYEFQLADGEDALWHVHFMPPPEDADAWDQWESQQQRGLQKTSDAVLIYTLSVDEIDALLLLFLADGAHETIDRSKKGYRALQIVGRTADAWRLQPGKRTDDWRIAIP